MKKFLLILSLFAVVALGFVAFFVDQAVGSVILAASPFIANMSRQELEEFAEASLSDNFDGFEDYDGFDDLDDDDLYDGFEDDDLSFMGSARSFLDEKKSGVYLTFRIVNNSGYSKVVCLNPAFYDTKGITTTANESGYLTAATLNNTSISEITAAGHSEIHAVIADGLIYGTAEAGITVTGVNGKIIDHLRFVRKNATRIPEITIASVVNSTGAIDTTFYSKIMTIRQVSPYRKFGDTLIDLQDFFKVEQYQAGKITVDMAKYKFQADDQTLLFVEIDNDRSISFTIKIGGITNEASRLYKKAEKATQNIIKGTAGVVPAPVKKQMKTLKQKQLNVMRKMAFGKKRRK